MPLLISPDLAQLGEHHDETVHPARLYHAVMALALVFVLLLAAVVCQY